MAQPRWHRHTVCRGPARIQIEEDLRIDGHTADLVPVFWLGVGPDGTIAAIQRLLSGVRFFDSVGNDLGLVGREGEGPEEFRVPSQAGWMGDTLWVSDFMLKRIALISTEPALRSHSAAFHCKHTQHRKTRFVYQRFRCSCPRPVSWGQAPDPGVWRRCLRR